VPKRLGTNKNGLHLAQRIASSSLFLPTSQLPTRPEQPRVRRQRRQARAQRRHAGISDSATFFTHASALYRYRYHRRRRTLLSMRAALILLLVQFAAPSSADGGARAPSPSRCASEGSFCTNHYDEACSYGMGPWSERKPRKGAYFSDPYISCSACCSGVGDGVVLNGWTNWQESAYACLYEHCGVAQQVEVPLPPPPPPATLSVGSVPGRRTS